MFNAQYKKHYCALITYLVRNKCLFSAQQRKHYCGPTILLLCPNQVFSTALVQMLDFIAIVTTKQHSYKGTIIKLCIKKEYNRNFFFSIFIYDVALARALSLLLPFLHKLFTWLSNVSLNKKYFVLINHMFNVQYKKHYYELTTLSFIRTSKTEPQA